MMFAMFLPVIGCGGNSVEKLIVQLGDVDPAVRRTAATSLGKQPGKASDAMIAALATASQDADLEVRELATASLGQLGPAAKLSEPALEKALADRELSVRLSAAFALQKIDPENRSYVPVILEALNAGHGTVFLDVGQLGGEAKWAVPTLFKLLSHQQTGIRALAARTLGQIGAAAGDAEAPLKQSLRDSDPAVRKAAKNALERIQSPQKKDVAVH
jgi:HEAT repeat protein